MAPQVGYIDVRAACNGVDREPDVSAPSGSPFESKPLEPGAVSRIGKISGQCPSPQTPCFGRKKEKTRVQSVDPAAPNSFRYGRSTVSIFSFANGALGEHRRHDTDGIRLEIDARRDQKWQRITLASSKTRGMNW